MSTELLKLDNLHVHFAIRAGLFSRVTAQVKAVDGVSFELDAGETLGLVGESGCGKTTLARAVLGLYRIQSGSIEVLGKDLKQLRGARLRDLRHHVQMVFQDPMESLNAKHTIRSILEEPYIIHRKMTSAQRLREVEMLLDRVGLPLSALNRFPFEFSGGQRQRIGIARAIALRPKLLVCDEPVSALDVSVQSQILNLLLDLQRELGMSYLLIAHGLPVVRHMSDRIAVMYLGKIVEMGPSEEVYHRGQHPYTKALLSAVPKLEPPKGDHEWTRHVQGEAPSAINPPSGCRFHTRCPHASEECRQVEPSLRTPNQDLNRGTYSHVVACHFAEELKDAV